MPRPNRRGPSRRGGSYSSRPAADSRPGGGYRNSGYAGGSRSSGKSQAPLYAALGGAAVVLVIVLVILVTSGGSKADVPEIVDAPKPAKGPTNMIVDDGDGPRVLVPFTSDEQARIRAKIEELDKDYDHAKDLNQQGHIAHAKQDYEDAQAAWQEAFDIIRNMQGESELLLEPFGDDAWDRLERFMPTESRTTARWDKLMKEFYKYLNRK